MNKTVDLNDLESYPEEFLNFIKTDYEKLTNTFRNRKIKIGVGSGLFEHLNKMLNDSYIKCIHASRTYDKGVIYKNGLFVPANSDKLADILLCPIREFLGNDYDAIYEKLKQQLKNNKYKSFHFVVGDISDITLSNNFLMLDKYGGELLEDTMAIMGYTDTIYKNISSFGIPVAVIFRIKFSNINDDTLSEIYSFMLNKAMKDKDAHLFKATYIFEGIPKEDIIEIKELKNYE